jgi:hypothetical protein
MLNISLQTGSSFCGSRSSRLLVVIVTVVMPVVVMMGLTYSHQDLCLRRIRCCEAEDEGKCEQNLLHSSSMGACPVLCRATLTSRIEQTETCIAN